MEYSKKLILVDAYAMIFRAYYALIQSPRFSTKGINTSAIFGFVNTLQDVLKREQPTHIAVCFDPPGGTFRHEAYEAYKAEREATPEDIKIAVPYIKRIIEAYRIPVMEVPGFEADDVIGTLATKSQGKDFLTLMMTPDKDFGQLVTESVKMYRPGFRGGEFEVRGVKEVCEKYDIQSPLQVIDILALMGDKADNIPGCPGVGEKTAIKLLKEFGNVETLVESTDQLKGAIKKKVEENVEQIKFSKFLATIKTDVPVDFDEDALKREPIDADALREVFEELEFRTLITRIIDKGEGNVGLGVEVANTAKSKEKVAKKAVNAQPSLFDFGDEEEVVDEAPARPAYVPTNRHNSLLTAADEVAKAVAEWGKLKEVGVWALVEGDESMTAKLLGLAVATAGGKVQYVVAGDDNLKAMQPLFANPDMCVVSTDVKQLMVLLRVRGLEFSARYFDVAVAHYLLQPERSHEIERITEDFLGYECINVETVLGPKGRTQKKFSDIEPSAVLHYACERAELSLALKSELIKKIEEEKLTKLLDDVELPLVEVLADMEYTGVRVDVPALRNYSVVLTEEMNKLEQECFDLVGEKFNTASPAQVGEVLFDKLKLDEKAKKTKSGQYSTTEEIMQHLRDKHPVVGKILDLRGIRKLLSTYVNALPELINPSTGRIHTTFNQTVTATGRLSSTNPNMQNIPIRTDEGQEIRRAFIPADGNVFFSADYSQIELRLVADMSGDATMVDAFCHDRDIHALTASRIYHEPLESVTPDQRRKAKTANFGILYGISAFGLAERLQIPRAEAKMLIDGYFTTFPGVRTYIDKCVEEARKRGYVTTLLGRRRMLPDINSRNAVVRSFSERNAVNAPIQGTAADIIKIAMVAIFARFKKDGLKSKMIMQVHDELNFDVVPSEAERVSAIVVEEMQAAYKGKVPLTASHAVAGNWLDAH